VTRKRNYQSVTWTTVLSSAALCLIPLSGCAQNSSLKTRADANPPRPEDEKFAEGAGRPATANTRYAYARILSARRQDAACDALLSRLIAEQPKFMPAYLLQAEVRMRMRHVDAAIATLRSALVVSPRDDIMMNNLGVCYLMKPDCPSALQCFASAATIQPSNARYRANMALALNLLGREDESASLYKMVVEQADVDNNLALLDSARDAYFGIGEPPRPITPQASQPAPEGDKPS
jgi:Flp pilus assembly protein TadD